MVYSKVKVFLKYLPIAITCENFSHATDLSCREKNPDTARLVLFLTQGIKQSKKKSGEETNQCLKSEKAHGSFHAVEEHLFRY